MTGFLTYMYLICMLVMGIILLNLVSDAFKRGIKWGVVCVIFPAGTYFYCRRHWDSSKVFAISILGLFLLGGLAKIIETIL